MPLCCWSQGLLLSQKGCSTLARREVECGTTHVAPGCPMPRDPQGTMASGVALLGLGTVTFPVVSPSLVDKRLPATISLCMVFPSCLQYPGNEIFLFLT